MCWSLKMWATTTVNPSYVGHIAQKTVTYCSKWPKWSYVFVSLTPQTVNPSFVGQFIPSSIHRHSPCNNNILNNKLKFINHSQNIEVKYLNTTQLSHKLHYPNSCLLNIFVLKTNSFENILIIYSKEWI